MEEVDEEEVKVEVEEVVEDDEMEDMEEVLVEVKEIVEEEVGKDEEVHEKEGGGREGRG